jgi:hypothetical protein
MFPHASQAGRLAHLSVGAEKFREAAPFRFQNTAGLGHALQPLRRPNDLRALLTFVDRVANSISIPFCDVQVLSTFAFCALRTRLGCRPHRHSTRTAHISGSWRLSQVRCCRRFHRNPRIAPHSVCPASNARVPGHWHHHRRVSGALAPPSKGIMSLLRRTS